jgi:putative hydrolase
MITALEPGTPSRSPLRLVPYDEIDRTFPVDYHNHTVWTDGTATSADMANAARAAGIREYMFSEHVRSTSTYFPEFEKEIRAIEIPGMTIFVGCEAKSLGTSGMLGAPPGLYERCDAVIGSVHSPPNADGSSGSWKDFSAAEALKFETALALAIVEKSRAHIIGHPLGMCITKFHLQPVEELRTIARACADNGKAFELNPRYSLDTDVMIQIVRDAGCKVIIGSDAHFTDAVGSSWRKFVAGVTA